MSCCSPDRQPDRSESAGAPAVDHGTGELMNRTPDPSPVAAGPVDPEIAVELEGGRFVMGTDDPVAYPEDGETFVHEVEVDPFAIDRQAVTNDRFAAFVTATGYRTDAERYGWSFVFGGLLPNDFPETRGVAAAPWWRQVFDANWRHPEGPQSGLEGRGDHPVVQVSHRDAEAFCRWAGRRLPTEAEWEYAARGGLIGAVFPWGDELQPAGRHRMNVWQGSFPDTNSIDDGFYGPAPVDTFEPNGYGLHNMCGNVWEWCSDWFDSNYYRESPQVNPGGPERGDAHVMRGGSYLCHASYCHRYRVAARSASGPDSSAGNLGFRTVLAVDDHQGDER